MRKSSTIFLQVVIVALGVGALALLLWEPHVEGVNAHATTLREIYFDDPFLALVYVGSIPFFFAIWQACKLLSYVRQNKTFSQNAVKALRTIKYCAFAIIGFVVVEELFIALTNNIDSDNPGAPLFMGLLIIFGSVIVATTAALFERTVQNATDLQSENDLTV